MQLGTIKTVTSVLIIFNRASDVNVLVLKANVDCDIKKKCIVTNI